MVADIGLRLQEGIQELKLEQQLAPAREAVARTFTVGSTNFFKAVEGVRGRWGQRTPSNDDSTDSLNKMPGTSTPAVEVSKADWEEEDSRTAVPADMRKKPILRPFSLTSTNSLPSDTSFQQLNSWGTTIGSFLSSRAAKFQLASSNTPTAAKPGDVHERFGEPEGSPLFDGMSPGVSPMTTAMAPASIDAVLSSAVSTPNVKTPLNDSGLIVTQHGSRPSELK